MLAFTFPGQGSQQPGMGQPWVDHPSWSTVERAAEITGLDLAHLLLGAGADELRSTENAQMATYVLGLVVNDALVRLGVGCSVAGGHSLGEYTALTATGALPLEHGLRLVAERGAAMAAAARARPGTMAAVLGADEAAVAAACEALGGEVWIANLNGAGQVVIAGSPAAVKEAGAYLKARGARKVMALPVGGAFHTPYMAPAAERLRAALRATAWADAAVPVVCNIDARARTAASGWAAVLEAQLTKPVRWEDALRWMIAAGVTTFLELGPGSVLTGVAKRIAPEARALAVATPAQLGAALAAAGEAAEMPGRALDGGQEGGQDGGEQLFATERLVVSPVAGVFEAGGVAPGDTVQPGVVIGRVAGEEIRSPFRGAVVGLLAVPGERLTHGQPVAWLRTA